MKFKSLTIAILVFSTRIALGQCPSYTTSSTQLGNCIEPRGNLTLKGEGPITLNVNGNLTINGDLNVIGEALIVTGELTVIGALNIGHGSSVTIKEDGIISVVSMISGFGSTITVESGGSLAVAQNVGSGFYAAFAVDFGASVYIGGSFVSGGIGLSAIDGDMRVEGNFTNTGGGVVEGNGVLMVGGTYVDNGDVSLYSGIYNGQLLSKEFIDFSIEREKRGILLSWQTEVEHSSHGFEVERSKDGENFKTVGWTPSYEKRTDPHKYIYVDKTPAKAISYYRLRKVKFDGNYEYSSVVRIDKHGNSSVQAVNPDSAIGRIRSTNTLSEFQLKDPNGNLILQGTDIVRKEAEKLISNEIDNGPAGEYMLTARIGESEDEIRLVKR